jgi:hypothetical protein
MMQETLAFHMEHVLGPLPHGACTWTSASYFGASSRASSFSSSTANLHRPIHKYQKINTSLGTQHTDNGNSSRAHQSISVIMRLKMKNSSSPCHEKQNLYQVLIIQNETEVQDESKTFGTMKNSIKKYITSNKLQLRVQNHELKLKTLGTVKPTVSKDIPSATN